MNQLPGSYLLQRNFLARFLLFSILENYYSHRPRQLSPLIYHVSSSTSSKLDCFVEVTDRPSVCNLVKANMKRRPRSLTAKLLCGILPLEVETGRYKKGQKVDREFRYCKVCNSGRAETEYHYLFSCDKLKVERSTAYLECVDDIGHFMVIQDCEKVRYLLAPEKIKGFGNMVENLFDKRRQCLFNPNK